jgi:hypothetical protein
MKIQKIIQESLNKNPLGMKEALEEELRSRVATILEAKMSDSAVLKAAKALASNGKNKKTQAFGQGLVDYYEKNGSFTPAQVSGLQNIMKNASFQMASEDLEEVTRTAIKRPVSYIGADGHTHTRLMPIKRVTHEPESGQEKIRSN